MENDYESSDFPTAAILLTLKYLIKKLDRRNPSRVVFIFEKTSALEADIQKLQRGQIKVDPLDFWYAQKRLKQMLYEDRQL